MIPIPPEDSQPGASLAALSIDRDEVDEDHRTLDQHLSLKLPAQRHGQGSLLPEK